MAEDLTLCMVVKNEAPTIEKAVTAAAPVCKDVLIVDTGSTDGTIEILRRFGISTIRAQTPLDDPCNIVPARNLIMDRVRTTWTLWLDGDEILLPASKDTIRAALRNYEFLGYFGSWLQHRRGVDFSDYKLFIAQALPYLRFRGRVHSTLTPAIRQAGGLAAHLTDLTVDHVSLQEKPHRSHYESQLRRELRECDDKTRILWFLALCRLDAGDIEYAARLLSLASDSTSMLFSVETLNATFKLVEIFIMQRCFSSAAKKLKEGRQRHDEVCADFEVVVNRYPDWIATLQRAIDREIDCGLPFRHFAR